MNLYDRLARLARYQPDKSAVESQREALTYGELEALAARIAGGLRAAGVGPGDLVGLRLHDTPQHIAALFAVMRLGAIILPVDWRGTRGEYDRLLARFAPRLVLDDSQPRLGWPGLRDLGEVAGHGADAAPPAELLDQPMGYSLTSGTTGQPKAMVVTHEQLYLRFAARTLEGIFARDDRFLAVWPLAYPAGREHAICLILLGATLVLFSSLAKPAELVDFALARGITATAASPNAVRGLLELGGSGGVLLGGLRVFVTGAAKLQPEERQRVRETICPRVIDYYGSTGTGPIAIISEAADGAEPTAVGRPVVGIEVQIVDDQGAPLPEGQTGDIRLRGPAISTRAVGDSGDGREGYRDGWYYPGDRGRLDGRGILHLEGRAVDLIKRGGVMVHAQEVELALRRHAGVFDAAVVGLPHPTLGQEIVAFVEARGQLDQRDLIRHCRAELAPFKVPARVVTVEALPRNANGKVDKSRLPSLDSPG
jgi:acyl-CoA synthetase (AMP-forming)/AMP-acid ligase II